MSFDLKMWLSQNISETNRTKFFHNLTAVEQNSFILKLNQDNAEKVILISSFDEANFVMITSEKLIWHCNNKTDESLYLHIEQFAREGDLLDTRYKDFQWRFFKNDRIIGTNNPNLLIEPQSENVIRLSSPLVFVKEKNGNYKTFKMEPGHVIDTLMVGIFKQQAFLERGGTH